MQDPNIPNEVKDERNIDITQGTIGAYYGANPEKLWEVIKKDHHIKQPNFEFTDDVSANIQDYVKEHSDQYFKEWQQHFLPQQDKGEKTDLLAVKANIRSLEGVSDSVVKGLSDQQIKAIYPPTTPLEKFGNFFIGIARAMGLKNISYYGHLSKDWSKISHTAKSRINDVLPDRVKGSGLTLDTVTLTTKPIREPTCATKFGRGGGGNKIQSSEVSSSKKQVVSKMSNDELYAEFEYGLKMIHGDKFDIKSEVRIVPGFSKLSGQQQTMLGIMHHTYKAINKDQMTTMKGDQQTASESDQHRKMVKLAEDHLKRASPASIRGKHQFGSEKAATQIGSTSAETLFNTMRQDLSMINRRFSTEEKSSTSGSKVIREIARVDLQKFAENLVVEKPKAKQPGSTAEESTEVISVREHKEDHKSTTSFKR